MLEPCEHWAGDYSYKIAVRTGKNYGNCSSSWYRVRTKQDALDRIRRTIKRWEEYDSIADHMGYKVTTQNTTFKAEGVDITLEELLHGQRGLFSFTS